MTAAQQHVAAHRAAGTVVHCRQLRAMPHLFQIPGAAVDQGAREVGQIGARRMRKGQPDQVPAPETETPPKRGLFESCNDYAFLRLLYALPASASPKRAREAGSGVLTVTSGPLNLIWSLVSN